MFKFNFNNTETKSEVPTENKDDDVRWYESFEISKPPNIENIISDLSKDQLKLINWGDGLTFSLISPSEVMNLLRNQSGDKELFDVLEADKQHSDLLPGKYEGGLKIWECTKDLAIYLENNVFDKKCDLNNKTILDLGCGSGILGIMCAKKGARVTFQDYNKEVLELMTIPNVFLNCPHENNKVKFYSGDWFSFLNLITSKNFNKYDYILTSETIYNSNNYNKLILIFKKLLKPDGIIFLSGKTHYFGVGGNIFEFKLELEKNNFLTNIVWKTHEGVSREIMEIKFQENIIV